MMFRLFLLLVSLIAAALSSYLTDSVGPRAVPEKDIVRLAVAKQNVEVGTKLENPEKLFEMRAFPKDSVPANAVKTLARLRGEVVGRKVEAGHFITEDDLRVAPAKDAERKKDDAPNKPGDK